MSVFLVAASALARTEFWAPPEPPRARYTVDVTWSEQDQHLEGTETIEFRNNSGKPMGRLAFRWLDAGLTVKVDGVECPRAPGRLPEMLFDLPRDLAPGDRIALTVTFRSPFPLSERTASAVTSFLSPRLWWGFWTGDDYAVRLHLPQGYTAATSGLLDAPSGEYRATGARTFGLFLGKNYESAEADAGGVRVRTVFTAAGRSCAELLLKTAVDAIGFYRQRFGFYPHRSLSVVPGSDTPQGGYPVAAGLVVIHGQEQFSQRREDFWRWITAHEIGHQYWSEHVLASGTDSLGWLMIGLGIHADREYRRARGIGGGIGELRQNFVNGAHGGLDTTMDVTADQRSAIKWDFNNVVEHGKSSAMLDALESVIGPPVFDAVYRRLMTDHAGKRLDWHEFQKACEAASGQDLDWFFEQWVRSAKNVQYKVSSQECAPAAGAFACVVRVERVGSLRMPIVVAARFTDGSEQRAFTERNIDRDEITFRTKAALKEVVLDPDSAVAMVDVPVGSAVVLTARLADLPWTGSGEAALALFREARTQKVDDASLWRGLALRLYDGRYYPEALETLEKLNKSDTNDRFMAFVWQGHILDLLGRRSEAIQRYQEASKVPFTQILRHDQYNLRLTQEWVAERLKTPFERK